MTSDSGGASDGAAACEPIHGATTASQRAGLKVFTNAVGNRTSSELLREDDQVLAHPVEIPETRFFPVRHRLIKTAGWSVGLQSRSFDPHQPCFAASQIPFHRRHQGPPNPWPRTPGSETTQLRSLVTSGHGVGP